jgi:hypothetical protein
MANPTPHRPAGHSPGFWQPPASSLPPTQNEAFGAPSTTPNTPLIASINHHHGRGKVSARERTPRRARAVRELFNADDSAGPTP